MAFDFFPPPHPPPKEGKKEKNDDDDVRDIVRWRCGCACTREKRIV